MIETTLEMAKTIAKTAPAKAAEIGHPMSVSAVDESGWLVYFSRANGAGFFTFDTARAKTMTAASFKRSTMDITDNKEGNPLPWYFLPSVMSAQALPSPDGVPVMQGGRVIGAPGLGSGSINKDHAFILAGAAAVS